MTRLVVLVSGSGSNLQAIIDAIQLGKLEAQIALVVSNRKAAYALERATNANIPTLYFPLKPYTDAGKARAEYDADLAGQIQAYQPDLIVLAGWMHVLSSAFLDCFPLRVINLHPALPGEFAGTHSIERAFEAFQKGEITKSGCMVHYVIPEVDAGAVIAKAVVLIHPTDTLEKFEARMHTAEHKLIIKAIQKALWRQQGGRGKWLCFNCRKSHNHRHAVCPDCGRNLHRVSMHFKPPRKDNEKEWQAVEMLYEAGIRFYHNDTTWQSRPAYFDPDGKPLERWQLQTALSTRKQIIRSIDEKYIGGALPRTPRDVEKFLTNLADLRIRLWAEIFEIHDMLGQGRPELDPATLEQVLAVLAKRASDETIME